MNTGYQQATIAFRVATPSNQPLDIDGNLISVSGKKQAIMLLTGQTNPDPNTYEIAGYFNAGDTLDGNPTRVYNTGACPIEITGYITVTPTTINLTADKMAETVEVNSSHVWALLTPPNSLSFNAVSGAAGSTSVTVTQKEIEGTFNLVFKNTITGDTATLIVNVAYDAIPSEYPKTGDDTILGDGYKWAQIAEQKWIQTPIRWAGTAQGWVPNQHQLDVNIAGFNPTFVATPEEMLAMFGRYYNKVGKVAVQDALRTSNGDTVGAENIHKWQLPIYADFFYMCGFYYSYCQAHGIEWRRATLIDNTTTVADPTGHRKRYPSDWSVMQMLGSSLDTFALSFAGAGAFQPYEQNAYMDFFTQTAFMLREVESTNTNLVNLMDYGKGQYGGWAVKRNNASAFYARSIRTVQYVTLNYDIYINEALQSILKIKNGDTVPAGYTVLPKDTLRGVYFGDPTASYSTLKTREAFFKNYLANDWGFP